jgi:glycosyltransferase involved in cell wall biosynthesis
MNPPPHITTIIPTFRRPERLKKTLQSVLKQTYPHFQICIYDNASQDETAAVVAEFSKVDSRIKYHCHSTNIGAAENFQFGLSQVNTPFFSFLSDDDYLLPEFYETALQGFERHPDAGFSSGAVIDVNDKHQIVDVILSRWPDQEYYPAPEGFLEMIGKYSNWIGTLFRKEVMGKVGSIDLDLKAIDIDYVFRAAKQFPFVISKKPVAVFVQHSSSYSKTHGFKVIWPGWDRMINKVKESSDLSLEVKDIAEEKLRIDLQKLLVMNMLRGIESKNFADVDSIMGIHHTLYERNKSIFFITVAAKLCKTVPLFHGLFLLLATLRRHLQRKINRSKYKQFVNSL